MEMNQYPRFQRGGMRQRPGFNARYSTPGPRNFGPRQFGSQNIGYNPRQSRPYFDRGRARGDYQAPRGYNNNPRYPTSSSRGRGQHTLENKHYGYGYEEEEEKGQFDLAQTNYVKTETYSTGSAANTRTTSSEETYGELADDSEHMNYEATGDPVAGNKGTHYGEEEDYTNLIEGEFDQGEEDEGYEDIENNVYNPIVDSDASQVEEESSKAAEEKTDSNHSDPTKTEKPNKDDNQNSEKKEVERVEKEVKKVKEGVKEEEEDGDSDTSEEDTGFCKYCKLNFTSAKAYHTHTRGIQHTTLVMEARAKKGNKHYQKELVEADVLKVMIPEPKKMPEPEEDVDMDDDNLNWMELDFSEDTKSYIRNKRRTKPEDRDLNPDDIGKSQFTHKFTCPLCDCKCTGALAFKMHIEGKQHKTNLEQAERGGPLKKKKPITAGVVVETVERKAKLTEQLKGVNYPIIGLEYVTEFQKPAFNAPVRYVCNLCESKCDASTIISHLIGIKHRMNFFQQKRPTIFEHLHMFTSKKNKQEMNANAEDLARDIEKEIGPVEVKVKIELGEMEEDIEEAMIRASSALKETVSDLERKREAYHPVEKKPRYDNDDYYNRRPPPRDYPPRGYPPRDYPPRGYPPRAYPPTDYPPRDYPPRDYPPRGYPRGFAEENYDMFRRTPYDAAYRERFAYRYQDAYYDRIFDDERRRLDTMMERRYRLNDPVLERERVDDIIARREYLERQEQARIEDILERRRRLQSAQIDDVDMARLKRFENRALPSETRRSESDYRSRADPVPTADRSDPVSSRPPYEERPPMEELLARRRTVDYGDRPRVNLDPQPQATTPSTSKAEEQQNKLIEALQAEIMKTPNVNISEIIAKLRSPSAVASGVDASMASAISTALTNFMAQNRLKSSSQQQQPPMESIQTQSSTVAQTSIPGLGSGTSAVSSTHVPSFLRNTSSISSIQSQYGTHTLVSQSVPTSLYNRTVADTDYTYPNVQQQTSLYNSGQQYSNVSSPYSVQASPYSQQSQVQASPYSQQSQVQASPYSQQSQVQASPYSQQSQVQASQYSQQSNPQPSVSQPVLQLKSPVSQLTYSQAAKIPAYVQSTVPSSSTGVASSNSASTQLKQLMPAPAKLLESIRQQTELLKQRLANAQNK